MKTLSLHQPWASLVSLGVKTIETRSWSTSYRGPLAIHAAKSEVGLRLMADHGINGPKHWIGNYCSGLHADEVVHWEGESGCDCDGDEERLGDLCALASGAELALFRDEGAHGWSFVTYLPLGAIVATCELVDVVPTKELGWTEQTTRWGVQGASGQLYLPADDPLRILRVVAGVAQRPYGDYSEGRFAWLLDNIKPCEPIPCKGRQGLWEWTPS